MQQNLARAEIFSETPESLKRRFDHNCRCRLVTEKEWVKSLLQLCGQRMHPLDLRRWITKYQDDCRLLRHCEGRCCP